jgi:hypothetical protein
MIIVKLMGGLGNQMFQYAFGKSLAILNNTELKIDRTFLDDKSPRKNFTFRDFELDVFKLDAIFATSQEIKLRNNTNILQKLFPFYNHFQSFSEHLSQIPKLEPSAYSNVYIEGYWQNEDYFKLAKEVIQEDFRFKSSPTGKNKELAELILSKNAISVHVRRGDYAHNQVINSVHGLLTTTYYEHAASYIQDNIFEPHYFVFSDDIEWAKSNIQLRNNTTYINHNSGKNSFEDLRLMSLCKHNIIANSSFSWWGAWLNANPDKIVIAPEKWFANPSISTDIIPSNWIKL